MMALIRNLPLPTIIHLEVILATYQEDPHPVIRFRLHRPPVICQRVSCGLRPTTDAISRADTANHPRRRSRSPSQDIATSKAIPPLPKPQPPPPLPPSLAPEPVAVAVPVAAPVPVAVPVPVPLTEVTVSWTSMLVAPPAPFVTTQRKRFPLSAMVVAGVV